ncbi:MAG: hypothetical protein HQM09_16405 [Candidatus Riflebacteria bacterium]|nr:hypothetical protein [Candidatus Riflebacteria bacterium]
MTQKDSKNEESFAQLKHRQPTLFGILASRKALAGLIIVVLVMGFMMAVSTSNILLVRTESTGVTFSQYPAKASSAAQAGINYYMGLLLADGYTFSTTSTDCRKRIHFLSENTPSRSTSNTPGQQIAICHPASTTQNPYNNTIAVSAWTFASGTTLFESTPDVASSALFMIKTYADDDNGACLASFVYIKSLGVFRQIDDGVPVASYYAQLNARLEINPYNRTIHVDRIRQMEVQYPDSVIATFHSSLVYPWN